MAITKIKTDAQFIDLMQQMDAGEITLKDAAAQLCVTPPGLLKKRNKYKRQLPPESLLAITSPAKRIFLEARAAGMGNKQSARLAYPDAAESSLPVMASQIMAEPMAQVAMQDLMARNGIDKNHRISVLAQVINSPDKNLAVKGLDQSWKLDGSYAPDRLDVTQHIDARQALLLLESMGQITRTADNPRVIETTATPA